MPISTNYCHNCHFKVNPDASLKENVVHRFEDITSRVATHVKHNPVESAVFITAVTLASIAIFVLACAIVALLAPPLIPFALIAIQISITQIFASLALLFAVKTFSTHDEFNKIHTVKKFKEDDQTEKPICLVVAASEDANGALKFNREYRKLEKKYTIIHETVSTTGDLNQVLATVGKTKRIQLLWVEAHGEAGGFELSKDRYTGAVVSTPKGNNFKNLQTGFSYLEKDATIVLSSCSTAKKDFVKNFSSTYPSKTFVGSKRDIRPGNVHVTGRRNPKLRIRQNLLVTKINYMRVYKDGTLQPSTSVNL